MTRSEDSAALIRAAGARARSWRTCSTEERVALRREPTRAPEVVVHQLDLPARPAQLPGQVALRRDQPRARRGHAHPASMPRAPRAPGGSSPRASPSSTRPGATGSRTEDAPAMEGRPGPVRRRHAHPSTEMERAGGRARRASRGSSSATASSTARGRYYGADGSTAADVRKRRLPDRRARAREWSPSSTSTTPPTPRVAARRARRARASTTSWTTSPPPMREWMPVYAAGAGREAAPPRAGLAGQAGGRQGRWRPLRTSSAAPRTPRPSASSAGQPRHRDAGGTGFR